MTIEVHNMAPKRYDLPLKQVWQKYEHKPNWRSNTRKLRQHTAVSVVICVASSHACNFVRMKCFRSVNVGAVYRHKCVKYEERLTA